MSGFDHSSRGERMHLKSPILWETKSDPDRGVYRICLTQPRLLPAACRIAGLCDSLSAFNLPEPKVEDRLKLLLSDVERQTLTERRQAQTSLHQRPHARGV